MSDAPQMSLLNRIGQELAVASAGPGRPDAFAPRVRAILGARGLSLWTLRHGAPMREAFDWEGPAPPAGVESDDTLLGEAQLDAPAVLCRPGTDERPALLSVPLTGRDERLVGALQIYGAPLDLEAPVAASPFVRSLGGMMGQFVERRQLELGATLLQEVHHRVKNNLHTVASLLRLQLRRLDRIGAAAALTESINRIQAIALVHDTLSRAEAGRIDLRALVREIATGLGAPVTVSGDALWTDAAWSSALALVVNELLQNALDHGVGGRTDGRILVAVARGGDEIAVRVADDGPGWPPGFALDRDGSLGLTIVATLVAEELRGTLALSNDGGAVAELRWPGR